METALLVLGRMFDSMADGVFISKAGGAVVYANAAAGRLLGLPAAGLAGAGVCGLLCGRLRRAEGETGLASCPVVHSGAAAAGFRGRLEGGGDVRVHCSALDSPFLAGLGPNLRLTLIEEAGEEAETERRKDDWRNMLVHDMRSPLANVFGVLRLLEEAHAAKNPQEAELLAVSLRSCRQVVELLDEYLDVAKLEAGLMPVREERVELDALAQRCLEEQAAALREKRIEIDAGGERRLLVRADETLLSRVVQNLIGNAVKFSPQGGRVAILTRRSRRARAELRIKDEGPGIAAEEQRHLFERFFQGRAAAKRGTGLGLAFCFQALRAMRGSIAVSSKPGHGSEFTVLLPAADRTKTRGCLK